MVPKRQPGPGTGLGGPVGQIDLREEAGIGPGGVRGRRGTGAVIGKAAAARGWLVEVRDEGARQGGEGRPLPPWPL